jgi:hypothetical protein
MMNKTKGPVLHKKHKNKGYIPNGLRGLDQQATWCESKAGVWFHGHGPFSSTSNKHSVFGCFVWMKNSTNEAKRMWLETFQIYDQLDYLAIDSKADDFDLFRYFKKQRNINLITWCRENMAMSLHRKKMVKFMKKKA